MKHEPRKNIQLVHPECMLPDPQLAVKAPEFFLGKVVKKRFEREHMWVLVDGANGDALTGLLRNEPFMTKGLKYDDRVEVRLNEIEAFDDEIKKERS